MDGKVKPERSKLQSDEIRFRVSAELLERAKQRAKEQGMPLSTLARLSLLSTLRRRPQ